MRDAPGNSDYIAEWTRKEIEANSRPVAVPRSLLRRVAVPLTLAAVIGGGAWGASSWREGSAAGNVVAGGVECEPSNVAWRRACHRPGSEPGIGSDCEPASAAWRTACQRPASGAVVALEDGPLSTGSVEPKGRKRTLARSPEAANAQPDNKPQTVAQAGAASAPEAKPARLWTDPDPIPAPGAARPVEAVEVVSSPEPVPAVLPPARPADDTLRPRIPERDAAPRPPRQRPQLAQTEEAAPPKPRIPEREARPKPKPELLAARAEEPAPSLRRAPPVKPAPVVARVEEEPDVNVNRPFRRRTVAAANLRERQPEPRAPRLELRQAREITEVEVEVREGGDPVLRRRGSPIWVVDAERRRRARSGNEFPAEFVDALRHYNTRYSMQSGW